MKINHNHLFLFLLLFVVIGLFFLPDYGVSWDEDIQRRHGRIAWDYVDEVLGTEAKKREPDYHFRNYEYNFYGTLFQMTCQWIEERFGVVDYRQYHLLRHIAVFSLFVLSIVFFYFILHIHFKQSAVALLGAAMLVLSPRIMGNAFFNTKDIVLMSTFIISIYTLLQFAERRNMKWAMLHALSCAVVINARLIGVYMVALTLAILFVELLQNKAARSRLLLYCIPVYLVLTSLITIALWPYLWESPVDNFLVAFELLSKYSWEGDMRYFNTWIHSQELPWHYAIGWIHISTPLVYLIFAWIGIFLFVYKTLTSVLRNKGLYTNSKGRNILVFFGASVIPLVAIISMDSVIYDSWRHLFFIYPGILALSLTGYIEIQHRLRASRFGALPMIIMALSLATSAAYIVDNHPMQHNYITIPAAGLEKKFDIDYWGVNYQTALRKLAAFDENDSIWVATNSYPGYANIHMLPLELRNRFIPTEDLKKANYYLTNYRYKSEQQRYKNNLYPLLRENEVLTIRTWNAAVIGVYRLK